MEAIIRLYNLGVTDGACTAGVNTVTAGTCLTTYRPSEDITRLEMAGMVHRLLNLTNARPAGLSAQSTTSTALVGAETPLISMRNADFSAQANTLVDEFYQVHNDAAGVAASLLKPNLRHLAAGGIDEVEESEPRQQHHPRRTEGDAQEGPAGLRYPILTHPYRPRRHEAVAPPRGLTAALVGLGFEDEEVAD